MNILPFPTATRRLLPGFTAAPAIAKQPVKPLDITPAEPTPAEWTRRGNAALVRLAGFIGGRQLAAVKQLLRNSEERDFFALKMEELAAIVEKMPKTQETDGQGDDAICHLRYFGGGDYTSWLTEKDMQEAENPAEAQWQAYGRVHWGRNGAHLSQGYICLPEIFKSHAELDFHFTPCTVREIKQQLGIPVEPAPVKAQQAELCLNSDTEPPALAEVKIKTQYFKNDRGNQAETSIGLWRITTLKRFDRLIRCHAILHQETGVPGVISHTTHSRNHHLASSDKAATAKEVQRVHEEGLAKFHELEPAASGASHPLRLSLARTAVGFQATLGRIATLTGLDVLTVYQLWRKYSDQCVDQSAVLSEFLQWYRKDLDPTGTLDLQATLYDRED